MYDLHFLVYSKPRGSVICESATALGLFLFVFFFLIFYFFLSVHSYLVDLRKLFVKKRKKKKEKFANMWRVCVFNFRDTMRMRIRTGERETK